MIKWVLGVLLLILLGVAVSVLWCKVLPQDLRGKYQQVGYQVSGTEEIADQSRSLDIGFFTVVVTEDSGPQASSMAATGHTDAGTCVTVTTYHDITIQGTWNLTSKRNTFDVSRCPRLLQDAPSSGITEKKLGTALTFRPCGQFLCEEESVLEPSLEMTLISRYRRL